MIFYSAPKTERKCQNPRLAKDYKLPHQRFLEKKIGSRTIRILHASDKENREAIEKSSELTKKLLHTAAQTKQYVRK